MLLKRVFYASASVLMLALAFHFGAVSATAQAPSNPIVASLPGWSSYSFAVVTANGDVYGAVGLNASWQHLGNVFAGNPTPVEQQSWGAVKSRYRQQGAAQPAPQDR
jgi:hypothetical protein